MTLFSSPCPRPHCDPPARNFSIVFRHGASEKRATTDKNGRYRIRLRAARYDVAPLHPAGIGWGLRPTTVTVRPGAWTRTNFQFDTGRR